MTIIRDGEKFACKQCIQGHRVSTCQHGDRPLLHVARKGRPVSQCVHCRGLRKARQTHIKCDCGERRHSRTNSSESATLVGSDDNQCQCGAGKKCSCALKKETAPVAATDTKLSVPRTSYTERPSGKPYIANRRSESAVPRMRNTYQPSAQRTTTLPSQGLGVSYHLTQTPASRRYHTTQRSADNLPLFNDLPSLNVLPNHQQTHLLAPSSITPPRRQSEQFLQVSTAVGYHNFSVSLDQNVLARTLSPQNPKRYSMNDWSMMTNLHDSNDSIQQPQHHHHHHHNVAPSFDASELAAFQFPQVDNHFDQWPSDTWGTSAVMPQILATTSDTNLPRRPDLSSSSTGTVSDYGGEMGWQSDRPNSYASSSHPTITLDTSSCQPSFDDDNNLSWTPVSYQEPDFVQFGYSPTPAAGVVPQGYHQGYVTEGDATNGQHTNYANPGDFVFPGRPQIRQDSLDDDARYQSLPDRSISDWSSNTFSEPTLDTAFKFPANDLCFSQPYSDRIEQKEWLVDDHKYLDMDGSSPMSQ